MEFNIGARTLALVEGDITKVPADAIANAANSGLRGGGGVDGAIHRAGGPKIMEELSVIRRESGGCPTGSAVVTGAGELPAKWVIHCVGPIYSDGSQGEPELLASCYRTAMQLAAEKGATSITFPSISTGVYGYPIDEAAEIAISTTATEMDKEALPLQRATFVLFGQAAYDAHVRAAERVLSKRG